MIEWITSNIGLFAGVATGLGAIISFAMKRWVTEAQIKKFGDKIESSFFYIGKWVTGGLSHWTYTKPLWNNIFEGYVILILREFFARIVTGLIKGLQSDNPSFKE